MQHAQYGLPYRLILLLCRDIIIWTLLVMLKLTLLVGVKPLYYLLLLLTWEQLQGKERPLTVETQLLLFCQSLKWDVSVH